MQNSLKIGCFTINKPPDYEKDKVLLEISDYDYDSTKIDISDLKTLYHYR